ncbi:hypothetical protein [Staphylococcus pseudoxylosus]|uniref:hypothetical protein n=1 Tax=Staphylococcus pseudoxylosus TaxID=2282419 RepID=UPI002DB85171|nr:hypothetical protein [Staphylococcus pseudoxylosus]MEB6038190.1 hypothetical protein [Staphylococcus pseudoxylosus]
MKRLYDIANATFINGTEENKIAVDLIDEESVESIEEILIEDGFPNKVKPKDVDYEIELVSNISEEDWQRVMDYSLEHNDINNISSVEEVVELIIFSHGDKYETLISLNSTPQDYRESTVFAESEHIADSLVDRFNKNDFLNVYSEYITEDDSMVLGKAYSDLLEQSGKKDIEIPLELFIQLRIGVDIIVAYDFDIKKINMLKFIAMYRDNLVSQETIEEYIDNNAFYEDLASYNKGLYVDVKVDNAEEVIECIKEMRMSA